MKGTYNGKRQEDPASWTRDILKYFAAVEYHMVKRFRQRGETYSPVFKSLFWVCGEFDLVCANEQCGKMTATAVNTADWVFTLQRRESKTDSDEVWTTNRLLQYGYDHADPMVRCEACGQADLMKYWLGLQQFPHYLILQFSYVPRESEPIGRLYSVQHDETITMRLARDTQKTTTYRLRAVVKYQGDNPNDGVGRYLAFTCSGDGRWWRCDGQEVLESSLKAVNKVGKEYACLAFYERQEDEVDNMDDREDEFCEEGEPFPKDMQSEDGIGGT